MLRIFYLAFFLIPSLCSYSQPLDSVLYRTITGVSNNWEQPELGAAGTLLSRKTPVAYADGMASPGGVNRTNPRVISNTIFAQEGLLPDRLSLSDFCWAWGQFLDHDLSLTSDHFFEIVPITVPTGDPWFDPFGMGQASIPMFRSNFDLSTGNSVANPRQHINEITHFIDGSAVYGSDDERADWLRTHVGGKLKTSEGNLLPFNTITGGYLGPIDSFAPHMDNATQISYRVFVAGDSRANENPLLLSFHTLFVREHNRICEELALAHPYWGDEELYQYARKIVGGLIQAIVYEEWLPTLGVHLSPYSGYDANIDPSLSNIFTAAAFRLGHTLLNSAVLRMNNEGELTEETFLLRDVFFNPLTLVESGGIEPFIKGMAVQMQQQLDPKIVDDVRNFLFGPPGSGGLDLAAININRGRERGIPDFNTVRESFGLQPYTTHIEINPETAVVAALMDVYPDVNDIDAWVGMLAETPMESALFGPTIMRIMELQFEALRDGDRFYYENDPLLSPEEKSWIKQNSLHDLIMRNTGITLMQDKVFEAMSHQEICDHMTTDLSGTILTTAGIPVVGVNLTLFQEELQEEISTDEAGQFEALSIPSCTFEGVQLLKEGDYANGLTTLDQVIIQRHILGVDPFDSPYQYIAADVDNNGIISTLDLIYLRQVILTTAADFPNNRSWRFIPTDYVFENPADPLADDIPDYLIFPTPPYDLQQNYVGVKVGDVNATANPGAMDNSITFRDTEPEVWLSTTLERAYRGKAIPLVLAPQSSKSLSGFQFSLGFDPNKVSITAIRGISASDYALFEEEGLLTVAWNQRPGSGEEMNSLPVIQVDLLPLEDLSIADAFWVSSERTAAVAYDQQGNPLRIDLKINAVKPSESALRLYSNYPNPFTDFTAIPFYLPADGPVTFYVLDSRGVLLQTERLELSKGHQEWQLNTESLPSGTMYLFQIRTKDGVQSGKMVKK